MLPRVSSQCATFWTAAAQGFAQRTGQGEVYRMIRQGTVLLRWDRILDNDCSEWKWTRARRRRRKGVGRLTKLFSRPMFFCRHFGLKPKFHFAVLRSSGVPSYQRLDRSVCSMMGKIFGRLAANSNTSITW